MTEPLPLPSSSLLSNNNHQPDENNNDDKINQTNNNNNNLQQEDLIRNEWKKKKEARLLARTGAGGVDSGRGVGAYTTTVTTSNHPSNDNDNRSRRLENQPNKNFNDNDDGDDNYVGLLTSENQQDDDDNDDNDDDFIVLTAAKRRRLEQEQLLLLSNNNHNNGVVTTTRTGGQQTMSTTNSRRQKQIMESMLLLNRDTTNQHQQQQQEQQQQQQQYTENEQTNLNLGEIHSKTISTDVVENMIGKDEQDYENQEEEGVQVESLLESVAALQQKALSIEERHELARKQEEERILREATKLGGGTNALQAASAVAQGIIYSQPMYTTWCPPKYIRDQGPITWQQIRTKFHMHVEGTNIPPPLQRFVDMKFPEPILQVLVTKKIMSPTPIQIQGLPVALACRDMVGIAFTGSGKTLTFTLPLVMIALEEELRMPLIKNEGPIGIILAPSRELARQTYELLTDFCTALGNHPNYPTIRCQLMIGGESVRDQIQGVQTHGVHCIVATPGRLRDVLKRKVINLSICRYICLDEADRMLDMGFDEEVSEIMNYFTNQRQTLLFSATFPRKFQDFARQTLVQPIVVNVGRAGAANLDVIQEVEYVKEEAKIVYLLHCLQKTAPPVIIFCERKGSADDIHEYLLLKGVEAVSIHGGKDQEERNEAIQLFKAGSKDVLIATDIAAKGLDFPAIQHVINFDMPNEIENYVHRIGRTGRAGKTGVATTFINKSCDETTLLDLKGLLQEAKQRIPPVLMMLEDPREQYKKENGNGNGGALGCSFCGGLGHTIVDCPKIDKDARRVAGSRKDLLATGGGDW